MARLIAEILKEKEPDFSYRLAHLEKLAGNPSLDLKLVSEMTQRYKIIINQLGLDEVDTTPKELFFALAKKALEDSDNLSSKIGIKDSDGPKLVAEKCVDFVNGLIGSRKIWCLRSSVAKNELKKNPPKKLVKILGLRSLDSALKRESLSAIYIFARLTEPKSWQIAHINSAKKLNNSDFDSRPIGISLLSDLRQKNLEAGEIKLNQLVYSDQETAGIIVVVPQKRFKGDALYLINSLIETVNKMITNSFYLKRRSLQPNFFDVIYRTRRDGIENVVSKHIGVGWLAYSKASINKLKKDDPVDEFDIDIDDGSLNLAIADVLKENTWDHKFLLKRDNGLIISCNLGDVMLNSINKLEPEDSIIFYGQSELKTELFARYLAHDRVLDYLTGENYG